MNYDIETTIRRGPIDVLLGDGTRLFTRYTETSVSEPKTVVIGGKEQTWLDGYVHLGPTEEWCIRPDGREERCSHMAEMMASTPKKPVREFANFLSRLRFWGRMFTNSKTEERL